MTGGKKILLFALAGAIALTLGSWVGQALIPRTTEPPLDISGIYFPEPRAIEDFTLIDQSGEPFHRKRFEGKWTFLYFGYTYCPDACPMTLAELSTVQKALAQRDLDQDTAYLFISVDPRRDRPEELGKYTAYFNPKFQGATGRPDELAKLAQELAVMYMVNADEGENYTVDHSSTIPLIGPDAQLHALFTPPHDPQTLVADFMKIRERYRGT